MICHIRWKCLRRNAIVLQLNDIFSKYIATSSDERQVAALAPKFSRQRHAYPLPDTHKRTNWNFFEEVAIACNEDYDATRKLAFVYFRVTSAGRQYFFDAAFTSQCECSNFRL